MVLATARREAEEPGRDREMGEGGGGNLGESRGFGGCSRRHVLIMPSLRRRRTRKKFNEDCARYF